MTDATAAKVWIVDDDQQVRESLAWLLGTVGLTVCLCSDGADFLAQWQSGQPGCVLLDVRMPGQSGLELQRTLQQDPAAPPVILMSGHADVGMAVKAMKDGACDFFEKPFNDQHLIDALQQAVALHQTRLKQLHQQQHSKQQLATLTSREQEVMECLVQGLPAKLIADHLGISPKTVDVHRHNLMKKLSVTSVPELIHLLVRTGREIL
ncbi:response regulator transcription factor [Marinospirillum alkaliphilum]|uniref:Two component transcriptional regulator, LuxR family n=1 Tax=Marinospirillum alkaliphilum DSM 21637 TaxID=1122209 RepID=A0A1K1Y592_9GAMM|nr:response regulator [Marinospirillum alkaliphilum]SFX56517.1 two component transcriptional regulator, LuxR family [Marinospirillum alkaliphilum DSM 21637]